MSSEAAVTSISSGSDSWKYVSVEPQCGQKPRDTAADEWYCTGFSPRHSSSCTRTVNQVTKAAPLARLQLRQWQWVMWNGVPRRR
ncbi:Uncharacterised protein [Chromobacterium violaceum]|uniref:Uncharacterized protein n=1 Tax=Chromobacterium violaceum TaxID=536 RepID=A0A447TAH9_CHRVL|nr:Uncharacterised protein [Chromobacterium violaceum]